LLKLNLFLYYTFRFFRYLMGLLSFFNGCRLYLRSQRFLFISSNMFRIFWQWRLLPFSFICNRCFFNLRRGCINIFSHLLNLVVNRLLICFTLQHYRWCKSFFYLYSRVFFSYWYG